MQNARPVTLAATLNRKGRDFTEEDRALLDLLRPHLLQAHSLAQTDRLATVARLQVSSQPIPATSGVGVVEWDDRGKILTLTGKAEHLLRVYFPEAGRLAAGVRLPAALARHVAAALAQRKLPVTESVLLPSVGVWHIPGPGGRQLKVRLTGNRQIFLEERDGQATRTLASALGLTPRESEVLFWVAEAKTNWAISRILGLSESTVGKHMEKILAKLHVPNRTAAVRALAEARADL